MDKINKKIDYTKEEFLNTFGIKESKFRFNIKEVMEYFNLDIVSIKADYEETTNYRIPYEIAPLLAMMISIAGSKSEIPYRKGESKISATKCIEYNNKVINELEKLPDYLKNNIKKQYFYKTNIELHKYMPVLHDRLRTILSIIKYKNEVTSGNIILDLIRDLDQIINRYLHLFLNEMNNQQCLETVDLLIKSSLGDKYLSRDKRYNINSLITETYNNIHSITENDSSLKIKNLKENIFNNIEELNINEIRNNYLEELNLLYYDDKISVELENFEKEVDHKIDCIINRDKYLERYKEDKVVQYINIINLAYKDYIDGNNINLYDHYIDIYILEEYLEKIKNSCKKEELVRRFAEEIVDDEIKYRKNLKRMSEIVNESGKSESIDKSIDILLGQVLLNLMENN